MISVLILTFNEACNIGRCLETVKWSDDVLILDSFSTDSTVEIARSKGIRVMRNRFVDFAQQRNFGIEHGGFKHNWVLHLDADEIVPDELRRELQTVARNSKLCAFQLASKMIFRGRWLRFSGMYPAYQVRFGLRDRLRFKMVGHGQRETLPPDEIGMLQNALIHYSFSKGMDDWHARHRRYALAEAQQNLEILTKGDHSWRGLLSASETERRRALKALSVRMPCRPLLRFFYMYILHLGFLDGVPGYSYSRLVAKYEGMIVSQLRELQRSRKGLPL